MPTPLVVQHYPDDFQLLTYYVQGALTDPSTILYADRTFVIDSITVTTQTANGSAATASFEVSSDPTSVAGTTMGTVDLNLTAGTTVFLDGVGSSVRTVAANGTAGTSSNSVQLSTSTNIIPAGSFLQIDLTNGTSWRGLIQVRFRSRQA